MTKTVRPLARLGSVFAQTGRRFNSTTPVAPVSEIKNQLTSFDSESLAAAAETASSMTSDQFGYLQSIGLASGWGPTSIIERFLEAAHVTTGLPWWATIIAGTFFVRVAMFPLYVKASANTAKMTKVKPQMDQLIQGIREAETQQERMQLSQERKKINKEHGIKMSHSFLPMLQLPIAYGFFQALRKMSQYPVEGFSTQGEYWFQDLTQVDPYLGLQVISAIVVIGMVRLGGETGAQAMNPMFKKAMTVVPVLSIFITMNMTAAVVLYFAANACASMAQALILKNGAFRRMAKIPPIEAPVKVPGAPEPPANLSEWWKDFNSKMKQLSHSKMTKTNKQLEAMLKRRTASLDGFIKRH